MEKKRKLFKKLFFEKTTELDFFRLCQKTESDTEQGVEAGRRRRRGSTAGMMPDGFEKKSKIVGKENYRDLRQMNRSDGE